MLLTGQAVARSYGIPLEAGIAGTRLVRQGLAMPLATTVLLLASAAIARMLRPPTRESLDGFMIGALGALSFTAAATLTRLAPQLPARLIARTRPLDSLLVEAMATDNGLGWHNVVSVRISAQVWAQPVPLELLLRTEVDLETGQVALAELAA